MRRTQTVSIGEVWDDFLRSSPSIACKIARAKAVNMWPQVVGAGIASCTTGIEFRGGVMHVKVNSSVVRNELFMRRATLREALNRAIGVEAVDSIIVK